ncbi:uncharacterized protein [Chironomus tepperi]|uniref:uncharacterized protein n=1 Tax=Chironomus tepperi TaxID=113505 RepID=UPI00391FBDC2
MLRSRILFNYVQNVNNLIVRNKSVVIRQIETIKLTKAQRMKKNNFETSYLFGSKLKNGKEAKSKVQNQSDEQGVNSEIYWTVESTKDKKIKSKDLDVIEKPKRIKKSTSVKKTKAALIDKEEKPTETFAKFKLDLPKPVKVTIQDALNNIDTQISSSDDKVIQQQEIPFDQNQLRNMINFPLIIEKNDLVLSSFDETIIANCGLKYIPSVSRILQATMSASQKQALLQWKNLKIAELGVDGFEELQKMYLNRGKKFHGCLQKYFNNEEMTEDDISMDIIEVWKSISHVIKEFEVPAKLAECNLEHPYLCYKGIVDCVAVSRKSNTLSVIEWKNSDRYKKSLSNTYDAPLQLCAYLAALNATTFKDNPITNGVIVVAYNDGIDADIFHLSNTELKKYWKLWLNRLQDYWIRYRDNTLNLDEI